MEFTTEERSAARGKPEAIVRITVHDKPGAITFQLEGKLAGPWVRVLEECWQTAVKGRRVPCLRLDLTGVTSIDAAGEACLAAMHRRGAEFIAVDPLTKGQSPVSFGREYQGPPNGAGGEAAAAGASPPAAWSPATAPEPAGQAGVSGAWAKAPAAPPHVRHAAASTRRPQTDPAVSDIAAPKNHPKHPAAADGG